jgi:hypothetical protein|tara:strand:- start:167 stop:388 length:222 start_codon:yes stop_codon:yes gene_type:complete
MGNVKKQIQDYYDKVVSIEGLERQVSESEDVSQVKRFINYQMKPKFQSEKDLCDDIAVELWNEYWSDYNEATY